MLLKVSEDCNWNVFIYILLLGSCLALALGYSGCCLSHLSSTCSNNGCYCDKVCHIYGDCCSDIAVIDCNPDSNFSSSSTPTPTDTLGKIKCNH